MGMRTSGHESKTVSLAGRVRFRSWLGVIALLCCGLLPVTACKPGAQANEHRPRSVTLTWKASASVNKPSSDPVFGYYVYRSLKSQDRQAKRLNATPIEETTFVDDRVEPGKTYFYSVRTVTKRGVKSVLSTEVQAVIPAN